MMVYRFKLAADTWRTYMKSTDNLPWGVVAFFFAGIVILGVYWYTQSKLWFYTSGPLWATVGGSYLHRVFKKKSD